MSFVLRMTARDMRGAWKRLVFFFICVAIGVGAIVSLRSVIQSVRDALGTEARTLAAADIRVQANQPWSDEVRQIVDERLDAHAGIERSPSIETTTMVRPADASKAVAKMVELRGVESEFPFYGTLSLEDDVTYSAALLADHGALVRPELLAQLDVRMGDLIVIGTQTFTIRGVIKSEPGRSLSAFSFGPRVIIGHDALLQSGLLTVGSRARYQLLLRVPEATIDPLVDELREALRAVPVRVRTYRQLESRLGRNLERAENYISLVGFVILVLGGIGVWSVTRVFVQQKLRSIAILKCVGASSRQVLGVYLLEIFLLGLGGSLLGIVLAALAIAMVPASAAVVAQTTVDYGLTWSAALQGLGVGLLVALLFAVAPLLDVRHIKPLLLLRGDTGSERPVRLDAGPDWVRIGVTVAAVAGLVALAGWQAGSARIGLFVCLGFTGVAAFLYVAGLGLVRAVAPLAQSSWFPLRHAVISLIRPGSQTRVILLAVGIGSFFIIGVRSLQANLLQEFAIELNDDGPDMFLLDIQQDQADGVRELLADRYEEGPEARLLPVLRGRVTGVAGRELNLDGFEDVRGRGSLGREYVLTYRTVLDSNEEVVDGTFWGDRGGDVLEVSIEESIRERFNVQIGDLMRFDILGRDVEVRVSSVREVDWDQSRSVGGFMFILSPAALADAPHSYIALLRASADTTERARLQRDLVARYPNVSAIDVREIITTVQQVVDNVVYTITMVGGVVLFTGTLILIGAVAMTKFQRVYEAAIFKTLGATSRTIATMLALEYGTLGTLAGLVGASGAVVLSWTLSRYVLEIAWTPAFAENLGGVVVTALTVGIVGVVASLDVLTNKPLATLRGE